jgi:hypothetical protein
METANDDYLLQRCYIFPGDNPMLKVNFDDFLWYRPQKRDCYFRWSDEKDDPLLLATKRDCQEYSPQEDKALFRTFAALGQDRGKILNFANKYGLLVGRSADEIAKRKFEPSDDWPISATDLGSYGPSTFRLNDWQTRIDEMKSLVDLVDLMTCDKNHSNKDRRLADPLKHKDAFVRALRWQPPGATRRTSLGKIETADQLAELGVAKIIEKFKAAVLHSVAKVTWDSENRQPILSIVPIDLAHFLYWQLCDSLFEGAAFRQCVICGKWVRPGRSDGWATCSSACRTKKCRNGKKKLGKVSSNKKLKNVKIPRVRE